MTGLLLDQAEPVVPFGMTVIAQQRGLVSGSRLLPQANRLEHTTAESENSRGLARGWGGGHETILRLDRASLQLPVGWNGTVRKPCCHSGQLRVLSWGSLARQRLTCFRGQSTATSELGCSFERMLLRRKGKLKKCGGLLQRLRSRRQQSVLIAGLARSGTTALFYKLKAAMPPDTCCLFEPPEFDPLRVAGARRILAKVILTHAKMESFDHFKKKILIVRGPRDRIVSGSLYRVYDQPQFCADEAKVAEYMGKLREKEANPKSVSMVELIQLCDRLTGKGISSPREAPNLLVEFQRANPDYFIYKYEDLVLGRFDALSRYLAIDLSPETARVPEDKSRVGRTKDSGSWRNWFLPEDVAHYRPLLEPSMDYFGYGDDWALAAEPTIAHEHASAYLARLVAERRSKEERRLKELKTP